MHGGSGLPPHLTTPQSVSPALIPAAPMAKTAILPSSVMMIKPQTAIGGLNWTQLPGAASAVAAAPDGSLWALSTQPSGADKYIWHYASGTWTNIAGLAAFITVTPDNTLYAVNSGGGTWKYSGGTWTSLGGGAAGITGAVDNSIYVLSNGGSTTDKAIWHNVNGTWTQVPGSGVAIGASWDTHGPFIQSNGGSGTIANGGFYILNSLGVIYYENPDGSLATLPGNATAIAPTTIAGVFVLGFPGDPNGNGIYYWDLNASQWNVQPGSAVAIATDSAHLYAVAFNGSIYSTPVTAGPQTLYVPNYVQSSSSTIAQWSTTASGNVAPSSFLGGTNAAFTGPTAVTRDNAGTIVVADFDKSAIYVFNPQSAGNIAPIRQILGSNTAINGPEGVGLDSSDNIYLSNRNGNSITVYATNANGNVAPTRTITGTNTMLTAPEQIVVNPGGDFYVTGASSNVIAYFPAGANGNVAPTRVISGSNTGISSPFGMALDGTGNIYVLNGGSGGSITIYAPASNGNVAPTRTISGSNTTLSNSPEGMAVDNSGNMYVTECPLSTTNQVVVFANNASGNAAPIRTIGGSSTNINCPLKPFIF